MMKKINFILIAVIGGLALLFLGFYLGQKLIKEVATETETGLKASKVISQVVARGTVAEIAGRNLTLVILEDNLVVSVSEDAKIVRLQRAVEGSERAFEEKEVAFGDIKLDDMISVDLEPKEGQFEGVRVSILPSEAAE